MKIGRLSFTQHCFTKIFCIFNQPSRTDDRHLYYRNDDFIFTSKIYSHNWRTDNPEQAEVFIIPTLLGWYCSNYHKGVMNKRIFCTGNDFYNYSINPKIPVEKVVDNTVTFLTEDPRSQIHSRNFKPHVMVASHCAVLQHYDQCLVKHKNMRKLLNQKVTFFTYESSIRRHYDRNENQLDTFTLKTPRFRCILPVPYVDWPFLSYQKLENNGFLSFENWKNRPIDFFFIGKMHKRKTGNGKNNKNQVPPSYMTRKIIFDQFKFELNKTFILAERQVENFSDWPFCDQTSCLSTFRCTKCKFRDRPNLQLNYKTLGIQSKFSLIIHGDTSSTSRLYDAITNGQIPIFISPNIYFDSLPFANKINWLDLGYFVPIYSGDVVNVNQIFEMIVGFANLPDYMHKMRFEKLLEHRRDLSWLHPRSAVIENILFDAVKSCRI